MSRSRRGGRISGLRRLLFFHAGILQNVSPLAARSGVTMLQMLTEVVCSEELFRIVALAELVYGGEVFEPAVPIWLGEIGELLAAVPAGIM